MVYMPVWVSKVGRTQYMLSFVDAHGGATQIGPVLQDAIYLLKDEHGHQIYQDEAKGDGHA